MATDRVVYSVEVGDVVVYGINTSRAVVYGRYLVTTNPEIPNYPESYPLLLLTCDGGKTWTQSVDPATRLLAGYVNEIRFLDSQHGWISTTKPSVCGPSSCLLRTGDGGRTWESTPSYHNTAFKFWSFESPWIGTAVLDLDEAEMNLEKFGYRKLVYQVMRTTNGGRSWEVVDRVFEDDRQLFDPATVAPQMASLSSHPAWSCRKTDDEWLIGRSSDRTTVTVGKIPLVLFDTRDRKHDCDASRGT